MNCRLIRTRLVGVLVMTGMALAVPRTGTANLSRGVPGPGSPPVILQDPTPTTGCATGSAMFNVVAGGTGPFTYEWRRNGNPLSDGGAISGATTDTLTILAATSEGSFHVVVSNSDGSTASNAAMLTVTCPGDLNCNGRITSHDFFEFVAAWFEGLPRGDFNSNGHFNSQDVFDYLNAFFTGC